MLTMLHSDNLKPVLQTQKKKAGQVGGVYNVASCVSLQAYGGKAACILASRRLGASSAVQHPAAGGAACQEPR